MNFSEKKLDETRIYEGKIINMRRDTVELVNGKTSTREVVEHSGGVCIAALDSDGCLFFVTQYRYPHERALLELPAGKRERDEDPKICAERELVEETGYKAKDMVYLGQFLPSSAYLTEVIHLFFAKDLEYVGQNLEADEFLSVQKISLEKSVSMVLSGEIADGKTQALVLRVNEMLKQK